MSPSKTSVRACFLNRCVIVGDMALIEQLIADLDAESASVDEIVADLPAEEWARPTPAEVEHRPPDRASVLDRHGGRLPTPGVQLRAHRRLGRSARLRRRGGRAMARYEPAKILRRWRRWRQSCRALATVPSGTQIPWFGPPMSAASMATAPAHRAYWAHDLDVAETLGVQREPTDRLKSIAHLGVRTRNFAYLVNQLEPPAGEFRIELTAPSGEPVDLGRASPNTVRGSAIDFCMLITQRRAPEDLALEVTGDDS